MNLLTELKSNQKCPKFRSAIPRDKEIICQMQVNLGDASRDKVYPQLKIEIREYRTKE